MGHRQVHVLPGVRAPLVCMCACACVYVCIGVHVCMLTVNCICRTAEPGFVTRGGARMHVCMQVAGCSSAAEHCSAIDVDVLLGCSRPCAV